MSSSLEDHWKQPVTAGVSGNLIFFSTFPCISSLMVRVTFSPPSDWTLMGSMSGSDVKEGAWLP